MQNLPPLKKGASTKIITKLLITKLLKLPQVYNNSFSSNASESFQYYISFYVQNIEVFENVSLLLALINKKNRFLLLYADVKLFLNEICDGTGQSQSLQDIISKW